MMIKGLDISHHNAPFPWDKLSQDAKFVYCKATQGAGYKDPEFNGYWQHLKSTELYRGAYHFLNATDSAQAQADNFLSRWIDFSKPNVLPPCLDVEDQVPAELNKNITKNKPAFIHLVNDWIDIVSAATGRKVVIYSYKNFFRDYLNNTTFPDAYLWLAAYQTGEPGLPKGYLKWDFWQYSQYGQLNGGVTGGSLDLDYFNGSIEELAKL